MIKARNHRLLDEALEEGVKCGLRRALKHREETLSDELLEYLQEGVVTEIWASIDERFHIENEYENEQ